jgi:fluoride exporter
VNGTSLLPVLVGAAVGAPLRYLVDRAVQSRHDSLFPWGTFTVNVAGSFLLGLLTGAAASGAASPELQAALGVGFCGALTTWSTLSYETLRLVEQRSRLVAVANLVGSIVAGLVSATLGVLVAHGVWP